MDAHPAVAEAIARALKDPKNNGYGPASGMTGAKEAIAYRYKSKFGHSVTSPEEDIIITSGCSNALQLAMCALVEPGQAILLPAPGFTIYSVIANHYGQLPVHYPLDPERQWEADLQSVERLMIETKPRGWVINNPSNPCGSVYSRRHLLECLRLAQRYKVVIIADEIYEDIVFSGHQYIPLASLAASQPVITCSGLAKRFMIPGWRVGWLMIHDPTGAITDFRKAFFDLSGLILGACTLVQAAVSDVVRTVPDDFNSSTNRTLERNADTFLDAIKGASTLRAIKPQGALYLMLRLPDGTDDVVWCQQLLAEENVLVLPGTVPF